tara:strand:+ start:10517 stop:11401 length:885 start_codon:yes stop_codon:yes gene_type:complete
MGNFANIKDGDELDNKYSGKVIVYVESESDIKLFDKIIGPGFAERLEFKVPPTGGTGCEPAKKRVLLERPKNDRVYALLDGEVGVSSSDGFERLLSCSSTIFTSGDAELDGIIFLAEHEAENILLRRADICAFIASDDSLVKLGRKQEAEIRLVMETTIDHYFKFAVCKYASARLHFSKQMDGILDSGLFWQEVSRSKLLKKIKAKVSDQNCNWQRFLMELRALQAQIEKYFEEMDDEQREAERLRLADGKSAMKKLRVVYKVSPGVEGHLLNEVVKDDYARQFRQELFDRTAA